MTLAPAPTLKHRIASIDILRGAIMIIMALDHVRDYLHAGHPEATDLAVTTPFLFFTRWITHFCAPTFVFLSCISAYIAGTRRTKAQLSAFLIKRGLWLIVVELVLINFAMTLDIGHHLFILQVIWAIGGSMIILGLLVWLPIQVTAITGAVIFFGHNVFDTVSPGAIGNTIGWNLMVSSKGFGSFWPLGPGRNIITAYALLPWTGVMLLGYVFGQLYKSTFDGAKRRRILLASGLSLLCLFIILRAFNIYGDPAPWSVQKDTAYSIISFFNVTKYPCSLIYLCMTLGTALIILSLTEKISNKFTSVLIVYGNVPLFYYLCHWYLIRIVTLVVCVPLGYNLKDMFLIFDPPPAYGFSLAGVYVVWIIIVLLLYVPCRWYSRYKKTHTKWWLSYL